MKWLLSTHYLLSLLMVDLHPVKRIKRSRNRAITTRVRFLEFSFSLNFVDFFMFVNPILVSGPFLLNMRDFVMRIVAG